MKQNMKDRVHVAFSVGDNLMVRNPEAIDEVVELLQENGLVLKVVNGLQDYISCEIRFSQNMKKAWLGEPYLLESLKMFGANFWG